MRVELAADDVKDSFKKGELDKLLAELGSDDFKTRKAALKKASALTDEKRLALYKKLKSSDDPELRYVASIMRAAVAYKKYPLLIGLAEGSKAAQDRQREAAKKLPLEIKLKKSGIVFRLIPAGKFTMGRRQAQKQAEVTTPFYMGKFEVTQEQWQKVMGSNPSYFKKAGKNAPVEMVSWDDCQVFIKKLSALEGLANSLKLSLPPEIEWEYACRAGTQTAYYTGTTEADLARAGWYGNGNANKMTHEVGQKLCNAFGLYDMHGNVFEWCAGRWRDNRGYGNSWICVLRGGCWHNYSMYCSSAKSISRPPDTRSFNLGLRLVLSQSVKK